MNKIAAQIFKHKIPNRKKLLYYGFSESAATLSYTAEILDGQFRLTVQVIGNEVKTEVIDLSTDDIYTLFLVDEAEGSFVGEVRAAYQTALTEIAEKCFDPCTFKSQYAQAVIQYIDEKYGDSLEFLWEKFDDNAIWRRKDNAKWYGILMIISKEKVGLPESEKKDTLVIRGDAETLANGTTIFPGYHMNKKKWITIFLDGLLPLSDIFRLVDESYALAKKK